MASALYSSVQLKNLGLFLAPETKKSMHKTCKCQMLSVTLPVPSQWTFPAITVITLLGRALLTGDRGAFTQTGHRPRRL
jgi:hypothetical protein